MWLLISDEQTQDSGSDSKPLQQSVQYFRYHNHRLGSRKAWFTASPGASQALKRKRPVAWQLLLKTAHKTDDESPQVVDCFDLVERASSWSKHAWCPTAGNMLLPCLHSKGQISLQHLSVSARTQQGSVDGSHFVDGSLATASSCNPSSPAAAGIA